MALNNQNHRKGKTSLSEINVTPFVDVMLVLLIVFMISAPLLQQGVEVNLPKANAGNLSQNEDPVVLVIHPNQSISINGKSFSLATVGEKILTLAKTKPNVQVLVEADEGVRYGVVAKVMALIKKANIHRVGLVTAPET